MRVPRAALRSASTQTFSQSKVMTSQRRASSAQQRASVNAPAAAARPGRPVRRARVQEQKVEPERIARQRQHAAELAGTDDADRHGR